MTETDDVITALGLVDEEIRHAVDDVKEQATDAVRRGEFGVARGLIDTADGMEKLRADASDLAARWRSLDVPRRPGVAAAPGEAGLEPDSATRPGTKRRYLGCVGRGERTPEAAFYRPILEALAERGGSAHIQEIIDIIERMMKDTLGEVDYQTLSSDVDTVRWRNTAQWARNELVRTGLVLGSRERGIWEISDAGRERLIDTSEDQSGKDA